MIDLSKTTFLLGSGISIPSGYPPTKKITDDLLSRDWLKDFAQRGREVPLNHPASGRNYPLWLKEVQGCVRLLRAHIDQYLAIQGGSEASYEDIYYLAKQLIDSEQGEYENPALGPLFFELRAKVGQLVDRYNSLDVRSWIAPEERPGLVALLRDVLLYIEEAVVGILTLGCGQQVVGLDLLRQFAERGKAGPGLRLVSLNHDTLLEHFFSEYGVQDGFRKE